MAQLNNIYKLIVEINDEMTKIDVNYSEELWFADIDEKLFSFKHKVHNWLREGENGVKRERVSKSSGLRSQSSAGQQNLDHQGSHPKRKLFKKAESS